MWRLKGSYNRCWQSVLLNNTMATAVKLTGLLIRQNKLENTHNVQHSWLVCWCLMALQTKMGYVTPTGCQTCNCSTHSNINQEALLSCNASCLSVGSFNSTIRGAHSLLLLVTLASELLVCTIKFCSVVYGITLLLPVINKTHWCVGRRHVLIAGDGWHVSAISYKHILHRQNVDNTQRSSTDRCKS